VIVGEFIDDRFLFERGGSDLRENIENLLGD